MKWKTLSSKSRPLCSNALADEDGEIDAWKYLQYMKHTAYNNGMKASSSSLSDDDSNTDPSSSHHNVAAAGATRRRQGRGSSCRRHFHRKNCVAQYCNSNWGSQASNPRGIKLVFLMLPILPRHGRSISSFGGGFECPTASLLWLLRQRKRLGFLVGIDLMDSVEGKVVPWN